MRTTCFSSASNRSARNGSSGCNALSTRHNWHRNDTSRSIQKTVLVASTLEQRWNDALVELEDVQNQIADLQQKENIISSQQREDVLNLAQDLPRLWKSHATSTTDKKRILQLLIQDITVEKPEGGRAILHPRWQGGQCEDLDVVFIECWWTNVSLSQYA